MSKKNKLGEGTGGYMSVDRELAWKENLPTIKKLFDLHNKLFKDETITEADRVLLNKVDKHMKDKKDKA